ncbi:MCE family protein [Mycolicibacterium sp. CH28]|uniref:MCE family protein n=1 Tax=Mycolicibacterium sp. CH28 TaxID=2512237 RepID=UPI001081818B|nr:MCE family protein [Mycolicibacterium sp. CH28]TGD87919.1 MCE family protein [Mycolicibacterium sp. CH28]
MTNNVASAAGRLAVFAVVCVVGIVALLATFGQLRLQGERTYRAEFTSVSGLRVGDFVRIAGVEVGKVKHVAINRNAVAVVDFTADDTVMLTQGTTAAIRWADPIGGRYVALMDGAGSIKPLTAGQTIPVERTQPAMDLDALLGGFRPLFRALNPDQVNALSSQLIQVFQDQGATIGSFLNQAAAVTNSLADRDDLIGQVITNLNVVLGSINGQEGQFAKTVDSLAELVKALAARKTDISNAVANTNAAASSIADLLTHIRPQAHATIAQTDRAAGIAVADHDYLDDLLNTLPDSYKALSRLGMYGNYFTFYLCDLLLKVNGKDGQPVYVKVVEQTSGRCTPK